MTGADAIGASSGSWTIVPWTIGRPRRAIAAYVLLAFAVCTANALSAAYNPYVADRPDPLWVAYALEYTSFTGILLAMPVPLAIAVSLGRSSGFRWAAKLLGGALAFSLIHYLVMVGCRLALWSAFGETYAVALARDFPFEFGRDAITYLVGIACIIGGGRLARSSVPDKNTAAVDHQRTLVTLMDAGRPIEIDASQVLAVEGAGNYVSLTFEDGSRKLLRTTLTATEGMLVPFDVVRTHKRWLVGLGHVLSVGRTSAGDYRLVLGGGLEAPLSRRQRETLERVREHLNAESARHP